MDESPTLINHKASGRMRTATLLSAVTFAGIAFFCIWLIPDHVQLHLYCSGCDDSVVGDVSVSNNAEFGLRCHRLVATGEINDSRGFQGFHCWKSADNQSAWCINISLWYPLVLSSLLPIVWIVRRLVRSRLQFSMRTLFIAVSAVSILLGSWVLTRQVGIPAVLACEDARLTGPFELQDQEGKRYRFVSKRVSENPLDDNSPLSDTTCHYLTNATTPLPLIVAFDWASMVTVDDIGIHSGGSGRAYYLWFYGAKVRLSHWDRPSTQVIYE